LPCKITAQGSVCATSRYLNRDDGRPAHPAAITAIDIAIRHTAASAWLSAGFSLAKVAAYLGETKEVVLATYAHLMPDDDRAREIMNAFFTPTRKDARTHVPSSCPAAAISRHLGWSGCCPLSPG
jgi:hypothetical protein